MGRVIVVFESRVQARLVLIILEQRFALRQEKAMATPAQRRQINVGKTHANRLRRGKVRRGRYHALLERRNEAQRVGRAALGTLGRIVKVILARTAGIDLDQQIAEYVVARVCGFGSWRGVGRGVGIRDSRRFLHLEIRRLINESQAIDVVISHVRLLCLPARDVLFLDHQVKAVVGSLRTAVLDLFTSLRIHQALGTAVGVGSTVTRQNIAVWRPAQAGLKAQEVGGRVFVGVGDGWTTRARSQHSALDGWDRLDWRVQGQAMTLRLVFDPFEAPAGGSDIRHDQHAVEHLVVERPAQPAAGTVIQFYLPEPSIEHPETETQASLRNVRPKDDAG
ncbi:hypothetical protein D3C73_596330 [compost metagenome]